MPTGELLDLRVTDAYKLGDALTFQLWADAEKARDEMARRLLSRSSGWQ
jgi:hypothetical protein